MDATTLGPPGAHDVPQLIGGEAGEASDGRWIVVENPATKTALARVPRTSRVDVDRAVAAADAASHDWSRTSAADRAAALHAIADDLDREQERLAQLLSSENGNALRTQSRGELAQVVALTRYFAGLARELKGITAALDPRVLDYTRREPYGVVGAIVPWNAPVILAVQKMAPAVLTGNTIVVKASEEAPLTVFEVARIFDAHLPAGVVNVIAGYGQESGAALAEHPKVAKVSFTGSTATGRSVSVAAAQRLAAVSLELGGKSPQLVFDDVDVEATADGVITAMRFSRQGQSCTAGSRLLVHHDIATDLTDALVAKLGALTIGDPLDESSDAGSLVNQRQHQRVSDYVAGAMQRHPDALLLGGLPDQDGPLGRGWYFEPTLFRGLPDDDALMREEVFGPVLSITTFATEDEAVARANDSDYGLAGFVWTNRVDRAVRVAHDLRVGWVQVNQGGGQSIGHSYGGVKGSGSGRELSLEGMLDSYTQIKQVSVSLAEEA